MCGVIAAIGKVDQELFWSLMRESEIRGIHNISKFKLTEKCWIGHTRYSTSGKDSQPIKVGKKILAFNGVVDMSTKAEMQKKYKIKMQTDNDGEVILQKCSNANEVCDFVTEMSGSFAGVFSFNSDYIYAFRNERRPLWQAIKNGCFYIASTGDIFKRAGFKKYEEMEINKLYAWKI